MSKEYREVAKRLDVRYLFGKWGFRFYSQLPSNDKKQNKIWQPRLIPLNGWSFDTHEIIEAIANDPDMSIKYGGKSE